MADTQFHAFQDLVGRWRWRLVAHDGETIATSEEVFDSHAGAIEAAEAVKETAPRATVSTEPVGSVREIIRVIAHRNSRAGRKRTRARGVLH